ncbi:ATP-binding protein [uncultured Deinococcus sp.]|uniref:ATP-binding protein n=1 Tax=uncultured Deinococcus sp. TaxID=158789 RepID=UPI0025D75712|nr:ATP-binding protein [uncultured Deinococcus sp.]
MTVPGTPLRVLIVDDSPEDTETFSRYLRRWPEHRVELHTAQLGEDALQLLTATPMDLLLLDYQLPDMTGLEFLAQAAPASPVIMLTGLGDERVAVNAMQAGAQDYLVKAQLRAEDLWRAAANATQRHALERDLRREQQRSQAILDSVTDGFLSLDHQQCVQYLNPAAEHVLDVSSAEILNRPIAAALPWLDATPLPAALHTAATERRTVTAELHDPHANHWLGARVYPAGDGLSVYLGDITPRRLAEERDRRATDRLRHLYGASLALNTVRLPGDAEQVIVEQAREVLGAQAAALALYVPSGDDAQLNLVATAGTTIGLPAPPSVLPLTAPHPLAHAARSARAQGVTTPATPITDARWTTLPIVQAGPSERVFGVLGLLDAQLSDADDQTLLLTYAELCAQALDRAALTEAERQHRVTLEHRVRERTAALERSNRELEQFAYVASHDLKEPLRTVSSFAQLLQGRHGAQLDERGRRYLTIVIDGAQRMFTLIEDVLAMARVSNAASPRTMDLGALLDDVTASLEPQAQDTGAQITADPLPSRSGDPTQFVQLFHNLLGNALKFRQPGVPPRIHVSARPIPGGYEFTVADNGIGIEAQYLQKVFTVFQRLHTRQAYPGNGIGLSVCQKIVESHGGRIWLESTPGEGTTVHFTLPDTPAVPA